MALADYTVVLLLAAVVGIAELVSRYRDAPSHAILTWPAFLYVLINVAAGLGALGLARAFGWSFGIDAAKPEAVRWAQILVAGFGSMAFFRTSLFNVRAGNQDISVGPGSILQIILSAADREVDRIRAQARADSAARILAGVSFPKAAVALPTYCLALMQNLSNEDQEQLGRQVAVLQSATNITDSVKTLTLGLALLNAVGEEVLVAAVRALGNEIK